MNFFAQASLCLAVLFSICGQLPASNYHVNVVSGNDSRSAESAQSPETPWKTIQRGVSELSPGDKLTVHAGTYEEADIKIPSGTSEKPVEIAAAGNVIISIKNPDIKKKQFTGLLLKGVRSARISGFTIYCGDPNVECPIGIKILDTNNCLIKNNVISVPRGYGILAGSGSSKNQIEHNSISGCGSGIVLAQNEGNLVTGNDIFDNTMSGTDIRKGARNNEFSDNLIVGNPSGVIAGSEGQSANNTFKNCEISGNKNYGIFIAGSGAVVSIRNSVLEKNLWKNIYCKDGAAYEGGSNYIKGGEKSLLGCKMAADDSAEKTPQGSGLLTPRKSPSGPDIKAAQSSAKSSGTKIIADPIVWKIGVQDKKFSEFIPPGSGKLNYDTKTGICVCDLGISRQFNAFPTQMASGALNTGYGSLPTHIKIRWDDPKGGARILKLYIAAIMDIGNLPAEYSVTAPGGAKYDFDLPPYAFGENTAFYEFPVIAQKGCNEMTISSNYADSVRRSYFMFDCLELLDAAMTDSGKIAVNFKIKGDKPVAQLTNLSDSAANLNIAFEWIDTAGKITHAEPAKQLSMPGLSSTEIELRFPAGATEDKFACLKIKVYDGPAKLKETGLVFWDSIGKIHAQAALTDICLRELIRSLTVESEYDKSFLSESRQKALEKIKAGRETQKNSLVEFENQFSSIYKSYEQKNNVKTAQLEEICRKLAAACREYELLTELCKASFPKEFAESAMPGLSLPVKRPDRLTRNDVRNKIIFTGNWFPSSSKVWSDLGFFRAFDFLGVSEDCITSKFDTEPGKYDFSLDEEAVKLNSQKGFKTVLTSPFDVPRMPAWLIKKHGLANLYLKGENGALPSGRWHPLNIFNPDVQDYCKKYYSALAEKFKDNNEAVAYETFNEPYLAVGSWDPAGFVRGGFNPEALAQYKEYLRKKYGTVTALNSASKTAFKDFSEINPPRGKTGEKIQPLLYDWSCFMSESLAEFMRSCYAEIRKKDQERVIIPQLACHFNYMVPALAGQIWGIDLVKLQDAINPYVDYFSFHGANTSDISYAASLSRLFDRPLGRDEYYWNAPGIAFGEDASSAFTERNMWEELARGSRYFEFFTIVGTDYSQYTSLLNHDCASHLMRRSAMTICIMKDIADKLTQTFNSTKYSENNAVAIIQPSVSTFLQYPPFKSGPDAYSIHNALEEDNRAITFLPEEFILNKRVSLAKYKIVILPYATYFPSGLTDELLRYVENGGILIASGACGIYTPEGLADGKLLKKLFGENAEVAYLPSRGISSLNSWQSGAKGAAGFMMRVDTDCVYALTPASVNTAEVLLKSGDFPIILEKKLGKGKFLMSSVPFGGSEYFEKIIRNYIARNAPPNFWSGAKNVGLIMRDYNDNPDKQCIIVIDRDSLRPENSIREARIFIRGKYSSINDLKRGGKEVSMQFENGVTSFKTFLYPGQGQVFSMVKSGSSDAAPAAESAAFQIETANSDYKAVPAMRAEFADLSAGIEKLAMLPGIWNFQVSAEGRKMDAAALHDGSSILIMVKIPGNFSTPEKMSMSLFFDAKFNGRETGGRFAGDDFKYTVYPDGKRKIIWGNKDDVFGRVIDKDIKIELKNAGENKIFAFSMPLSNIFQGQESSRKIGFALSLESGDKEKTAWPDGFDGSTDTSLFGKLLLAPAEASAARKTFMPNKDGFITHWLAAGPFPNPGLRPDSIGRDYDFLKNSGGEDLAAPGSGVSFTVSQSREVFDSSIPCVERLKGSDMLQNSYSRLWRALASNGDFIDLAQLSKFNTNVVFYTYCEVVFGEDKELSLAAGSDDGIKVWINGAEVMNVHKYRGAKKDEDIVHVKVKKGRNKILVKTDTDIGGFGFYLRFLDVKGNPETSYKILN